jgi:hypothetical protein
MLSKISIILSVIILSACATDKPVIQTVIQRVEIPISVPCKADIPATPTFNFDTITVDKDIFEKSKALLADRQLQKAYSGELLAALKSCK